jgi:hypothetical protein
MVGASRGAQVVTAELIVVLLLVGSGVATVLIVWMAK